MSRKGNCWDNAPQESFFAILKTEMDLSSYNNYEKLGIAIYDYISYYNYDRPQKAMNCMTPHEHDQYLDKTYHKQLLLPLVIQKSVIYI